MGIRSLKARFDLEPQIKGANVQEKIMFLVNVERPFTNMTLLDTVDVMLNYIKKMYLDLIVKSLHQHFFNAHLSSRSYSTESYTDNVTMWLWDHH